jgi:hypothetical protein
MNSVALWIVETESRVRTVVKSIFPVLKAYGVWLTIKEIHIDGIASRRTRIIRDNNCGLRQITRNCAAGRIR